MGKREDICNAALAIVSEEGVRGLTLPRLFERANTGSGTFYHYFKDRDDLLDTLYFRCYDIMQKELVSADDKSLPFPERLEKLCICAFDACNAYPSEFNFLYWESCGYVGLEKETCRLSPFMLMFSYFFSQAKEAGELKNSFSSAFLARMTYGMVESALWGYRRGYNALDETAAIQLSRFIWSGLTR